MELEKEEEVYECESCEKDGCICKQCERKNYKDCEYCQDRVCERCYYFCEGCEKLHCYQCIGEHETCDICSYLECEKCSDSKDSKLKYTDSGNTICDECLDVIVDEVIKLNENKPTRYKSNFCGLMEFLEKKQMKKTDK
jgi:hypothetical protein